MTEKILILDFGSQYTQLIARAVREANVYCEIKPFNSSFEYDSTLKGIILSGSPASVNEADAPNVDIQAMLDKLPVLTVCYGAQLSAKNFGGKVEKSNKREYGRAQLRIQKEDIIFKNIQDNSQVWMSHSDSITQLPENFELLADTDSIPVAAFRKKADNGNSLHGFQFHPEVYHSTEGKTMIKNFLVDICGCAQNWTPDSFVNETVEKLKVQIGDDVVLNKIIKD
jgi:GMP synthase (glutamine-hydrolysing)